MKLGDFIPASIVHQKPDVTSVGFGLQVKGQPGNPGSILEGLYLGYLGISSFGMFLMEKRDPH